MKKFNFRLEKILNFRKQKEEQCKIQLSREINNQMEENRMLGLCRNELHLNQKDRTEVFNGYSQGIEFALYEKYKEKLEKKVLAQVTKFLNASHSVNRVQNELKKVSMDREILDRLKEKQHKGFLKEADLNEQGQLDEMALRKIMEK